MATIKSLTQFLDQLDEADIPYTVSSVREGALLVGATIDDEHWEFEFLANGKVEVQVFVSEGEIEDESGVERFLEEHVYGAEEEEADEEEDEDDDEEDDDEVDFLEDEDDDER